MCNVVLVILLKRLDQLMVMNVTSGVQLAAILAESVITNTSPSTEELIVLLQWFPSHDLDHDMFKAKKYCDKNLFYN